MKDRRDEIIIDDKGYHNDDDHDGYDLRAVCLVRAIAIDF